MTGVQKQYEDLVQRIDETEVVSLCGELVRFHSVNPPGDELAIAQFAADHLREAGLTVEMVPHGPHRASLLARLKGSGELPALVYCGHLDVVPVGEAQWEHDPFGGALVAGELWGRGSSDMKSGVAAMMTAAKVLARAKLPLRGDLVLAFTAGEEVDELGAVTLAARPDWGPLQALVISEPTRNGICVAEKGQFWVELSAYGKAAHGSTPHLGQNAIMMMVALLSELEQLAVPYVEHPLLGGFTRSVGTIQGGVSTNIVPERCVATLDHRTVPGQDHGTVVSQIQALIADLSRRLPGFRASAKVITNLPAVATPPDHPIVQRFSGVVTRVTGEPSIPRGVAYATDAASLVPVLKVPLIICGPGDADLAHQRNERVQVDKLIESARIFTLAAVELLM